MRAVSAATRKSEASAMAAPAPATVPFSDATIGWGAARMARIRSQVMVVNSSSAARSFVTRSPMMSFTSPPVQKALPVPVMTATRIGRPVAQGRGRSRSARGRPRR